MSDNLTHIKDIGLAREKWLNDHGIATYTQLAEADSDWICEQLKNDGKPSVPLEVIRGWIEEASTLIVESVQSDSASNVIPIQSQNRIPITEDGWDEFASFYISYQHKHQSNHPPLRTQVVYRTYADHIEANENQQWDGIEGDDLCHWIMSHVNTIMNNDYLEAAPGEAAVSTAQSNKPSEIRIVSIRVHDSVGGLANASAGEVFKGAVHRQQPLTFDFNLEYVASNSQNTKESELYDCQLSLYIYEMPGNKPALLPQKILWQLPESGQTSFTATITTLQLPVGLYRIRAVATLTNQTPVLSIIDIPLLQIL